jgi:hypothetical protein
MVINNSARCAQVSMHCTDVPKRVYSTQRYKHCLIHIVIPPNLKINAAVFPYLFQLLRFGTSNKA